MSETHEPSQHPEPPPPTTKRRRSHAGRIAGAALAIATTAGVGTGLLHASHQTPAGAACGGTERWDVKGADDQDADSIDDKPITGKSIADLNQLEPGPTDDGGRMAVEKNEYTITGYLAFFKPEPDSDYHIVISDGTLGSDKQDALSTGHTIVVEIPDPNCFAGAHGDASSTSRFQQQIEDARKEFMSQTADLKGASIAPNSVKVTVTGVAFFDFLHRQHGHSLQHTGADGGQKVIELHPVTAIEFDGSD